MLSEVIPVGIPLHRRDGTVKAWALVDADDYDRVKRFGWNLLKSGYAKAQTGGRTIYLHRLILRLKPGDSREADHINRDRLDCRRANLRVCTRAENAQNHPGHHWATSARWSRHRGVSWSKVTGRWQAGAMVRGERFHLGYFEDEEKAAEATRAFRAAHMTHATD